MRFHRENVAPKKKLKIIIDGVNTFGHVRVVPRKRKDGKEQVNSWVDPELAEEIRVIQEQLGLQKQSDVVKFLLALAIKIYGNSNNPPIRKNRPRTEKSNPRYGKK